MADYQDILLRLSKRLYPRGRAWKMPFGGFFEKLHKALAKSENRAILAANSILDSTLPDNDNFDETDAANWERCLGIPYEPGITLEDRKAVIRTYLNHPGTVSARQTRAYIESVLRAANFDVYVYENRFLEGSPPEYVAYSPGEFSGTETAAAVVGCPQVGQVQCGQQNLYTVTKVANHVEDVLDADFNIGDNYRSIFFIAGQYPTLPSGDFYATVPAVRRKSFRWLILKLKPQQTIAILYVKYT